MTDPGTLRATLERLARAEGFTLFGIAEASEAPRRDRFERWLDQGLHRGLSYLKATRGARADVRSILPGARSVVVLGFPHGTADPAASDGTRTARYALGPDYHKDLRARCRRIVDALRADSSIDPVVRICVDSAPIAERSLAAAAGLGWIGKNGMLLNERHGSYFLLCEILTDLELPPDQPVSERCGTCTRCLSACPTDAFVEPGLLDAGRCVSYWTIEQRETIPDAIAEKAGAWVFGCDICQEVCPYNAPISIRHLARTPPTLSELAELRTTDWRHRFRDSAMERAGAAGLRRNAAAAAGARHRVDLLPVLRGLTASKHSVVAAQATRAVARLSESDESDES